ncbi:hypothetical protein GCM10020219_061420 [Nonomuraea dietziae]
MALVVVVLSRRPPAITWTLRGVSIVTAIPDSGTAPSLATDSLLPVCSMSSSSSAPPTLMAVTTCLAVRPSTVRVIGRAWRTTIRAPSLIGARASGWR